MSIHWDINKTLSYQCLFNFITGSRGVGKTYGTKKFVINRFLKHGEQFIYLRRYKTEFNQGKNNKFFDALIRNNEFSDHHFKVEGNNYFCDDQLIGQAMALSTAKVEKSQEFPNVKYIIFDEFLIENNGIYRYLPNDVTCFLDFYETIARMRDVIVFFLSNNITEANPYYMYFNLHKPYNNDIYRKGDILLQLVNNQEYINAKNKTRFGSIIRGTKYGNYAIENKSLNDTKTFLSKKTKNSIYFFSFIYNGITYGVWRDYTVGRVYVSTDVDPCNKLIYSITLKDHTPNTLLLKGCNRSPIFKSFVEYYKRGLVFYENQVIKYVVYDMISLFINL